jgi:hypothetical protein
VSFWKCHVFLQPLDQECIPTVNLDQSLRGCARRHTGEKLKPFVDKN